jgi:hypothetical protein
MNENIKRILEKSTYDVLGVKQVDQEMFAKLLIEECCKVCEELRFTKEGPSENAAYQRILCSTSIKENFGLISKGPITALNIK